MIACESWPFGSEQFYYEQTQLPFYYAHSSVDLVGMASATINVNIVILKELKRAGTGFSYPSSPKSVDVTKASAGSVMILL